MKPSSDHQSERDHPSQLVMLLETFPTTMAVATLAALGWLTVLAGSLLHPAQPITETLHSFAVWATVALPPVFLAEPLYRIQTDKNWPPYGPRT